VDYFNAGAPEIQQRIDDLSRLWIAMAVDKGEGTAFSTSDLAVATAARRKAGPRGKDKIRRRKGRNQRRALLR